MDELFAGLDISTQGAKLVIFDWTNLTESYVDSINYDNDLPWYGTVNGVIKGNKLGVSESNPLMWIAERILPPSKSGILSSSRFRKIYLNPTPIINRTIFQNIGLPGCLPE